MAEEADYTTDPKIVRERILHTLSVFPVLQPTMLQSGLGPQTSSKVWRPILDELLEEGLVVETVETRMTPLGRYNRYTKLSLKGVEVNMPEEEESEQAACQD